MSLNIILIKANPMAKVKEVFSAHEGEGGAGMCISGWQSDQPHGYSKCFLLLFNSTGYIIIGSKAREGE